MVKYVSVATVGSYSNWEDHISERLMYPVKCGYMVMASRAKWRGIDCNNKLFSLCSLRNHSGKDIIQLFVCKEQSGIELCNYKSIYYFTTLKTRLSGKIEKT